MSSFFSKTTTFDILLIGGCTFANNCLNILEIYGDNDSFWHMYDVILNLIPLHVDQLITKSNVKITFVSNSFNIRDRLRPLAFPPCFQEWGS